MELRSVKTQHARHEFVIGGEPRSLTRQQVLEKLKSVKPGICKEHIVHVGGVWHPLKKAFATVTGLDLLKFQTAQALTVFEKLGFKVDRISNRER